MIFKFLFSGKSKQHSDCKPIVPSEEAKQDKAVVDEQRRVLFDEMRQKASECKQRLKSDALLLARVCQFSDPYYGGLLCVVARINTDISWLVKSFWEYDRSGEHELRDITGASIADQLFKEGCRPVFLQGEIEDIDWKDFMAMLLPNDYPDHSFLAGFGGATTVSTLYAAHNQGDFDSFYYVEILEDKNSVFNIKDDYNLSTKEMLLKRKALMDTVFGEYIYKWCNHRIEYETADGTMKIPSACFRFSFISPLPHSRRCG